MTAQAIILITMIIMVIINLESPAPDNVQGYWLKNLTPLHDKLVVYLLDCLDSGVVPDCLTSRRRAFIQKNKAKEPIPINY